MRKTSAMGSSRYEFNPNQLEIDYQKNKKRFNDRKIYIESELQNLINSDPARIDETWELIIQTLREIKKEKQYE